MSIDRKTPLVHAIWGLGGAAVGAAIALLVIKGWTPDWIEASGTWFGAIGTILTLLWAVQSFRSDRIEKERTRQATEAAVDAERAERERAAREKAAGVSVELRGGAGHMAASGVGQTMTSIHIWVRNLTETNVIVKRIILDDRLLPLYPVDEGFSVAAGETESDQLQIEETPAREGELSGRPLTRFSVKMIFRLDGRDWRRSSDGELERA